MLTPFILGLDHVSRARWSAARAAVAQLIDALEQSGARYHHLYHWTAANALAEAELQLGERASAVTPLEAEAGWTALLRMPAVHSLDDAGWTLDLLQHAGVHCQPGFLYDLDDRDGARPILALSLLADEGQFAAAVDRVLDRVAAVVASGP